MSSETNFSLENIEQQLKKIRQKYESKKKVHKISTENLKEELEHLDQVHLKKNRNKSNK